jgi:hypothetical protein
MPALGDEAGRFPESAVLREVGARTQDRETFEQFQSQGERCGWCRHPVRLVGSRTVVDVATGEITERYSTANEPDKVLLKACGTRRTTRCPSCAATYGADARMLVRSGLSGGKGVPDSVSCHPMVFATLTAPSFGSVHRGQKTDGSLHPCRPGNRNTRCPHGRPLACWERHDIEDTVVGDPLCADCYDYERAVLWNASCPELWRRTTVYLRRELARMLGLGAVAFGKAIRVSFTKVAEYQRRGVVHLHAVIRLDAATDDVDAPRLDVDAATLTAAIQVAASKVSIPYPQGFAGSAPGSRSVRWGGQVDTRIIGNGSDLAKGAPIGDGDANGTETPKTAGPRAVGNYIAKYACKGTDEGGALDRRLVDISDLDVRGVTGHLRRMVETAWELGGRTELASFRLRAWAHTLGFGGHWLTKSRRYSVTFGHLRAERQAWQVRRCRRGSVNDSAITEVIAIWEWVGTGWRTRGDAWLAELGSRRRLQSRVLARESLCLQRQGFHDTITNSPDQLVLESAP